MRDYKNLYELLNDQCDLVKHKILDIGTTNGEELLVFNQHGFTQLIGIDKKISITSRMDMFIQQLLIFGEIKFIENKFHFANSPKEKYNSTYEVFEFIKKDEELYSRFKKLDSEIELRQDDFNEYPREELDSIKKFNLVMCSFVLHFYPKSDDNKLIKKLKSLILPDGYLYIKVHNLKRLDTYSSDKTHDQLKNVVYDKKLNTITDKDTSDNEETIWYLFDNIRIEKFIKSFKFIYQSSDNKDFSEIILQNS